MEKQKHSSARSEDRRKRMNPVLLARSFRMTRDDGIRSDVDGSYTGISRDGESPVQDVDDL